MAMMGWPALLCLHFQFLFINAVVIGKVPSEGKWELQEDVAKAGEFEAEAFQSNPQNRAADVGDTSNLNEHAFDKNSAMDNILQTLLVAVAAGNEGMMFGTNYNDLPGEGSPLQTQSYGGINSLFSSVSGDNSLQTRAYGGFGGGYGGGFDDDDDDDDYNTRTIKKKEKKKKCGGGYGGYSGGYGGF